MKKTLIAILLCLAFFEATSQTLVARIRVVSVNGQDHDVVGVYNGDLTPPISVGDTVLARVNNDCVTGTITSVASVDTTTHTFSATISTPKQLNNSQVIIYRGTISDFPANVPTDLVGCMVSAILNATGTSSGGGGGAIDTIYDYNELRNYTGHSDFVLLTKPGIHGIFRRVGSGNENGGTIIRSNNGSVWERVFDKIHFYPEWWEIGGKDQNGNDVDSTRNDRGILDSDDQINAALSVMANGGVLVLTPGKVYLQNEVIEVPNNVIIEGNGATLKRGSPAHTVLASSAPAGSTAITVVDASQFRVGDAFLISTSPHNDSTSVAGASSYHVITSISGNVIQFNTPLSRDMPGGADVFIRYHQVVSSGEGFLNITFKNLVIDGNVQENGYTYAWAHNQGVNFSGNERHGVYFYDCTFKNMPSENVIVGFEAYFKNCVADSLYGGYCHGSTAYTAEEAGPVIIDGLRARNICLATAAENGHAANQGIYTQSVGTSRVVITNSYVENVKNGGVVGPFTSDSDYFAIKNNVFKNIDFIGVASSLGERVEGLIVEGNTFENCGLLYIGSAASTKYDLKNIRIANNYFLNSRLLVFSCEDCEIKNNNFRLQKNSFFTNYANSYSYKNATYDAFICFKGKNSRIANNTIISDTIDEHSLKGILFIANNASSLSKNVSIENNTIVNTVYGIYQEYAGNTVVDATNNIIRDNNIELVAFDSLNRQQGIRVASRTNVVGNKIRLHTQSHAIYVYGVSESLADADTVASIVSGNIITGPAFNQQIYVTFYGSLITDNIMTGDIYFASANIKAKNNLGTNTKIDFDYNQQFGFNEINLIVIDSIPVQSEPNGSLAIDHVNGDLYLRKNSAWNKAMTGNLTTGYIGKYNGSEMSNSRIFDDGVSDILVDNSSSLKLQGGASFKIDRLAQSGEYPILDLSSSNGSGLKMTSAGSYLQQLKIYYDTGNKSSFDGFAIYANGSTTSTATKRFAINNSGVVEIPGQMGIGTDSPSGSAALEISSTTQGFLPPRMTQAQRDAIASPATGLTIYCTDCAANDASTGVLQTFNGTVWKNHW